MTQRIVRVKANVSRVSNTLEKNLHNIFKRFVDLFDLHYQHRIKDCRFGGQQSEALLLTGKADTGQREQMISIYSPRGSHSPQKYLIPYF